MAINNMKTTWLNRYRSQKPRITEMNTRVAHTTRGKVQSYGSKDLLSVIATLYGSNCVRSYRCPFPAEHVDEKNRQEKYFCCMSLANAVRYEGQGSRLRNAILHCCVPALDRLWLSFLARDPV